MNQSNFPFPQTGTLGPREGWYLVQVTQALPLQPALEKQPRLWGCSSQQGMFMTDATTFFFSPGHLLVQRWKAQEP